jgi:glycosyltransferase involved in cell wall biosynthesis
MDFSILIPTMKSREKLFKQVLSEVQRQISEIKTANIEVIYESDNGELTLGAKRNLLISRASGKYCCFVDDDDVISPNFLKTFLPMLEDDYDCSSFVGAYYDKGKFIKLFYHSLDIKEWYETPDKFWRSVSPLNMIRTDICRKVKYADIRNTEDHEFSKRLLESGLLKKEYKIPMIAIYHYIDGVKQNREEWHYRWNGNFLQLKIGPFLDNKIIKQILLKSKFN